VNAARTAGVCLLLAGSAAGYEIGASFGVDEFPLRSPTRTSSPSDVRLPGLVLKATQSLDRSLCLVTYWTFATRNGSLTAEYPGDWSYSGTFTSIRGEIGGEHRFHLLAGRLLLDAGLAAGYLRSRGRALVTRQISPDWNRTVTTTQGFVQSFTFGATQTLTSRFGLTLQAQVLGIYNLRSIRQDSIFEDGYGPVPYRTYSHYSVDPYGQWTPCIGLQLGLTFRSD
jgi:hypothetical protein